MVLSPFAAPLANLPLGDMVGASPLRRH